MSGLTARVQNGRLVMDEPTDLPEGTELHLVADDEGDDLGPEERAALHAAIRRGSAQAEAGELLDAREELAKLRSKR